MKKLALAVFAALALATHSYAATAAGTQELLLNGGIDIDSPAGTSIALESGYGYFVADYVEVGGLFGFANDDILTSVNVGGFAEYNIETETNVLPFLGSRLRLVYADLDVGPESNSETAVALGLYGGVKFFVTEELAVSVRALVETATEDIYVENDEVSNVDVGIDFGLRYFY